METIFTDSFHNEENDKYRLKLLVVCTAKLLKVYKKYTPPDYFFLVFTLFNQKEGRFDTLFHFLAILSPIQYP